MIVITRSCEDSGRTVDLLDHCDSNILVLPCLEFRPPSAGYAELDKAIRNNQEYNWVLFLSCKAAEVFFERLLAIGGHLFHLSPNLRFACIGAATRTYVEKVIGFPVDFVPSTYNSNVFVHEFAEFLLKQKETCFIRIILPRTDMANDDFVEMLESYPNKVQRGSLLQISVHRVPAYESSCPDHNNEKMKQSLDKLAESFAAKEEKIKIIFTSSQIVRNFKILTKERVSSWQNGSDVEIYSIGPKTSQTVREVLPELGGQIIEPKTSTMTGLIDIIMSKCHKQNIPKILNQHQQGLWVS